MKNSPAKSILYAVGSLPFWTGRRKLIQFLSGTPGSFWSDPPPLKPIYLGHRFFGQLESLSGENIRSELERLKHHGYLVREALGGGKPHRVVKFTHEGVLQYYNLLVLERNLAPPCWRLHHVSRLSKSPESSIATAGQLISFSDNLYLTQTPEFVEPEGRIKDEATLQIPNPPDELEPGSVIYAENLEVECSDGARLGFSDSTRVESVSGGDLSRKLTHFPSQQGDVDRPNPYVIRGNLTNQPDRQDRSIQLILANGKNQKLSLVLSPDEVPDEVPLTKNNRYVAGPVETAGKLPTDYDPKPVLTLKTDGSINLDQPNR